jgi:four helix bundle protein
MSRQFDHEKLHVYQRSIDFVAWADSLLENLPRTLSVSNQLDRASTSIPLNIAEGNGKFTDADRCRFFDIARGSALECAAALDIIVAKKRATKSEVAAGRELLVDIVSLLVGLIRSNSKTRVFEETEPYQTRSDDHTFDPDS